MSDSLPSVLKPIPLAPPAVPAPAKKFPIIKKNPNAIPKSYESEPGVSLLPISRVHRIIKADKDVRLCSKEAIFLISKATEFFLGKLANTSYSTARLQKRAKTVKYSDLASVISRPEWFYLQDVIPQTLPLSKALSLRTVPAEGSTSLIEPSDENHPSHPSRSHGLSTAGFGGGPGAKEGGVPVKKARKKSIGGPSAAAAGRNSVGGAGEKGEKGEKNQKRGRPSGGGKGTKKEREEAAEREREREDQEEEEDEEEEDGMEVDN